jgi:putative addiction module antidote
MEVSVNTVIRKIGNSEGVILPKELLNKLNLQAGDALEVKETTGGLTLTPVDDSFERQMEAARKVMDKYKVALQKLAE